MQSTAVQAVFARVSGAVVGFALLAALTAGSTTGCSENRRDDGRPLTVVHAPAGDVTFRVDLARTSAERQRGLMWRTEMAADEGMLFVFPAPRRQSFWMKNTPLPLDIVFIRADGPGQGVVDSIGRDTTPYSEAAVPSSGPVEYVLEVNAGVTARRGIEPGARVTLPKLR